MRAFFPLFLCLLTLAPVSAQPGLSPAALDSLEQLLPSLSPQSSQYIDNCLRLSEGYRRSALQKSLHFALEGLDGAMHIGHLSLTAQAYDLLGKAHFQQGNYAMAGYCFEKGIHLADSAQNDILKAHLFNSSGLINIRQGSYEAALGLLLKAHSSWVALGNQQQALIIQINIAGLYQKLERYDLAIQTAMRAMEKAEKLGMDRAVGSILNNLGTIYEELESYDQALSYYQTAYERKQKGSNPISTLYPLVSIYEVYNKMGQKERAESVYKEAMEIALSNGNRPWIMRLYQAKGRYNMGTSRYSEALSYLLQALQIAEQRQDRPKMQELHKELSETYAGLGSYQLAYEHQLQENSLREELEKENDEQRISDMAAKYQLEDMETQIAELKNTERFTRQRMYLMGALLLAFLLTMALLFSRNRVQRRARIVLEKRNREIERQHRMLGMKNKEIQGKNQLLEDQSQAITQQNKQLRHSNESLELFAYAASHDLREPLRTIHNYMEIIQRKYGKELEADILDYIRLAADSAASLDNLLRDLLAFSRVGRKDIALRKVDLDYQLRNAQKHLDKQIKDNQAVLEWADLPVIEGYGSEIYLLFQNLITNAIKYRQPGVQPIVRISAQQLDRKVILRIVDNGIGIPRDRVETIFNLFKIAHNNPKIESHGIGLATCKKIMDHHNGQIKVESVPNKGSTFVLEFPQLSRL